MNYVIKTLAEVGDDELCSVDETYTVQSLTGLINAHHIGAVDIEEHCFFCHKDGYQFAPKSAPALVKVKE